MIIKLDARVGMLSFQIVPEDNKVARDESLKRTNNFSTIVTCRRRSYLLFIGNSALNSESYELVSQL